METLSKDSGVALASVHFTPLAALPSAFASLWQLITGTVLASRWGKKNPENDQEQDTAGHRIDSREDKLSNASRG
jgi:bile acid:Na+ symporter, BASS family